MTNPNYIRQMGASLLLAAAVSSPASAGTYTDSSGRSVEQNGRGVASTVRSGVITGGINGGNIIVIPRKVKEVAKDLEAKLVNKDEVVAECTVPTTRESLYAATSQEYFVGIDNYNPGTYQFGHAEYIKNYSNVYMQFKGKSTWKPSRIYKNIPPEYSAGSDSKAKRENYYNPSVTFRVVFNKYHGYSVTSHSGSENRAYTLDVVEDLSDYTGQRARFSKTSASSYLNFAIVGLATVDYDPMAPTGATGMKYLATHTSFGSSGSGFAVRTAHMGKYPPYLSKITTTGNILEIEHLKNADGNYSDLISMKVQTAQMGTNTIYRGRRTVSVPVLRLNTILNSDCGGYGCWYDDFTVYSKRFVNRNQVSDVKSPLFIEDITCRLN